MVKAMTNFMEATNDIKAFCNKKITAGYMLENMTPEEFELVQLAMKLCKASVEVINKQNELLVDANYKLDLLIENAKD